MEIDGEPYVSRVEGPLILHFIKQAANLIYLLIVFPFTILSLLPSLQIFGSLTFVFKNEFLNYILKYKTYALKNSLGDMVVVVCVFLELT